MPSAEVFNYCFAEVSLLFTQSVFKWTNVLPAIHKMFFFESTVNLPFYPRRCCPASSASSFVVSVAKADARPRCPRCADGQRCEGLVALQLSNDLECANLWRNNSIYLNILTPNMGPNVFQQTELNMTQLFTWVSGENIWTPFSKHTNPLQEESYQPWTS